jgi:undecaprenyl-diphosphatase
VIDLTMLWVALLLGVIEGLTEFLPISSTGHLIVVSSLVGFDGRRAEVFQIFIQLGAILAVVWEYRARLLRLAVDVPRDAGARDFVLKLGVAFAPAVVVGLLLGDFLEEHLFRPGPVAAALVVGAILILVVEARPHRVTVHEAESVSWGQALGIGLAQCIALWPGFSRSAATILGGLTMGLDRRAATEFSFFLAIPTLSGATVYHLFRNYRWLEPGDVLWLALASAVAFVVALMSIRWLLRYVSTHSFRIFAWYRLALGGVILLVLFR